MSNDAEALPVNRIAECVDIFVELLSLGSVERLKEVLSKVSIVSTHTELAG